MMAELQEEFDVDLALDSIDLTFPGYIPSEVALEYFMMMRLVTGKDFEFSTPKWHYFLVDVILGQITDTEMFPYSKEVRDMINIDPNRISVMASRGVAKSSVVTAFFPIYCAIKGVVPGKGKLYFLLALGASTQGGGRVMAKAIQSMCEDSKFCKEYFEHMRFTETEAEWTRKGNGTKDERTFLLRTMGVGTGSIRGIRSNVGGHRPDGILFDDCIANTAAAYSETQMEALDDAMNSDAINALKGGGEGFIIVVYTPFHTRDPNVKNVVNRSYTPVLIPICERIDENVSEEEFVGAWEEMHPHRAVQAQYIQAKKSSTLSSFMLERMLRMSSAEDRMISDDMIQMYDRSMVMSMLDGYNIYITTDFTTTSEAKSDYSAISCWAVGYNHDFFLLDVCVKKQSIQEQYDELFRMVNFWKRGGRNIDVGIEIDGQQRAHLFALKEMMIKRNEYFNFARQKGAPSGREGILSRGGAGGNKHERFRMMLPHFQNRKLWFPNELMGTPDMKEAMNEMKRATYTGFSGHDDFVDTVSQLGMMDIIFPSEEYDKFQSGDYGQDRSENGMWFRYGNDDEDDSRDSVVF
jgi:phage terminase large subunit-like protein